VRIQNAYLTTETS